MKRRTKRAEARAIKKLAKARGMDAPSGESKYARTRSGDYVPRPDPHRRPCWFVRLGWAAHVQGRRALAPDAPPEIAA